MLFEILLFSFPVVFWPLYRLLRGPSRPAPVYLKRFTWIYLALQVIANVYVWYCLLGGYRDWLISLVVPYSVLYLGVPTGLVLLVIAILDRPVESTHGSE